jgi:methionyl-tRNA formyltransferase
MPSFPEKALHIAFMGTADFAVPLLRALAAGPDQIAGVFAPPDMPAGRGRRLRAPAVKAAAQELGLDLYQPPRVSKGEGLDELRRLAPDLLVVAAFGEILTEEALSVAKLGAVNLHASLLPSYRGAAPIQRALMAGERVTGVTLQWMAVEMDAGDIILQQQVEIGEEEHYGSLHDRLAALGAAVGVECVALMRRGAAPRLPQDASLATYAPPIGREELVIDWGKPARELALLIRALSPFPGARTTRQGEILKILSARDGKKTAAQGGMPGDISELTSEGFWVSSGEGSLLVRRVHPAGRKVMSAADYLKGYRLEKGERLGV